MMDDNTPLIRINPISLDLGTIFDVVCDRVDCQVPARLRNHVDALGRRVVVRNGGLIPLMKSASLLMLRVRCTRMPLYNLICRGWGACPVESWLLLEEEGRVLEHLCTNKCCYAG